MSIGEVWLPWTEDPNDKTAVSLRQSRLALGSSLYSHFQATGVTGAALEAVQNAANTEDAMSIIRGGINGGTVRYLKAGASFENAAQIDGLSVKLLGPPTDQKFLSIMNPPTGDRFLAPGAGGNAVVANSIVPFGKQWRVKPSALQKHLIGDDKARLEELTNSADALAFALDSVLNNTSLVSLLTFKGRNLLFPGDAQYGNWESWMQTPDGQSILGHLDFLKIAHHGSVNATPKSALEENAEQGFRGHDFHTGQALAFHSLRQKC